MVKMEDAVIAKYEKFGHRFEILVDPFLAMELKHGNKINFDDLLASDEVFKDARKGDRQSEANIREVFKTTDIQEIAKTIIKEGEVQLTTELRRQMLDKRRKEIIDYIAKNAYDPKTKAPHPPQRIENAINELRISIDLHRSTIEQANAIVKELKKVLPITIDKIKFAVRIPAEYAGKASAAIHKYEVKQEQWQSDGSLIALFEISAGAKISLLNELNHITHGSVEVKILGD
ncbi:MAG: ribosome assembly factor SBDS [Candidatus Diapherotrites archaeon]|nr:ribosome assembly factor SBDS [Candidatus Diapherotrites archaeon]